MLPVSGAGTTLGKEHNIYAKVSVSTYQECLKRSMPMYIHTKLQNITYTIRSLNISNHGLNWENIPFSIQKRPSVVIQIVSLTTLITVSR